MAKLCLFYWRELHAKARGGTKTRRLLFFLEPDSKYDFSTNAKCGQIRDPRSNKRKWDLFLLLLYFVAWPKRQTPGLRASNGVTETQCSKGRLFAG